jgi:hypothetical protein
MACSYIVSPGDAVFVPDVGPLSEPQPLPPLPPLDPLPDWTAPDTALAPSVQAASLAPTVSVDPLAPLPWLEGDAGGVVAAVMQTTGSLASSSQDSALASIDQLAGYAAEFTPVTTEAIPTAQVPTLQLGDAPVAPDLTPSFPTLSDAPAVSAPAALDLPEAPGYDVADVTISDIALPDPFDALEPSEPDLLAVQAPAEPNFVLPAVPTLLELTIPDAPVLVLPVFAATMGSRPDAPSVQFTYAEVDYASTSLTAMNQRLTSLVLEDATEIETIEQQIWDRGAAREARMTERDLAWAERLLRSRGHRTPQATLTRVLQQAMQRGQHRAAGLQRDIAIEQGRLKQQNLRFAIETAVSLESLMIDKHNAAQARALEAAKVLVTVQTQLFNAQVQLFQADVQAFGIRVQVFNARLQAALARIEIYKAQLEAERAKGEVNTQRVAIYLAQIEGVRAIVATYTARVDAARELIESNKALVEAQRARIQALEARVEAKQSEYANYAARMNLQGQRAQLFGKQVEAYRSRVGAFDALVKARVGVQTLRFKQTSEFPLELYRANIDAFKSATGAAVERLRSIGTVFSARVRAFSAQEGARVDNLQAQIKVAESNAQAAISEAESLIEAGRANLQVFEGAAQTVQSNMRVAGQLAGQLAAAAVAAQSVNASISESGSRSVSNASSDSATNSQTQASVNSTGESASNNTSISANNGTSRSTSVTNSHGRSYNRGYSNSTGTSRTSSYTDATATQNTTSLEARNAYNVSVAHECTDRTIHRQ